MSIKVVFEKDDPVYFYKCWIDLYHQARACTRYLPKSLETWRITSKDLGLWYLEKSFILLFNAKPVAGVFLPFEKNDESVVGSIMGSYIDAPLIVDRSYEKKVFKIIDTIALEENCKKIMFLVDALDDVSYNFLQKYNYLDTSFLNYIINIAGTNDLLKACRKGHRSDIKKILNNSAFEVFFIDSNNPRYDVHEQYQELHHKCSGRITRPKETFDLQFEKLKSDNAVLFGLKYKGRNIGFTYFEFHDTIAAYTSGSDDPEFDSLPLYHVQLFKAMEYLRARGIERMNTGAPSGMSMQMGFRPDNKQLGIARFKRGFAGHFVQNYAGVKYFSKELFQKDMKDFVADYCESETVPFNLKSDTKE